MKLLKKRVLALLLLFVMALSGCATSVEHTDTSSDET